MQKIYDNHCTELAPHFPPDKKRCYHPLFGVYHPHKLDQIRGVFDSSTKYEGVSLNDQQMQGPDRLGKIHWYLHCVDVNVSGTNIYGLFTWF
jgi:hypothetical protein